MQILQFKQEFENEYAENLNSFENEYTVILSPYVRDRQMKQKQKEKEEKKEENNIIFYNK